MLFQLRSPLSQVYGTRNVNATDKNVNNALSTTEDLHAPIQLQLSMPEQQDGTESQIQSTNLA